MQRTVQYCDRCGKECKYIDSFYLPIRHRLWLTPPTDKVDLCKECTNGLVDFLKNKIKEGVTDDE